jgi:hypothetical protein
MLRSFIITLAIITIHIDGFQLANLSSFFTSAGNKKIGLPSSSSPQVDTAKDQLLQTISNTKNGKDATLETQKLVLRLVDFLESTAPVSKTLLTDPKEAQEIDGVWYLQYTQPSDIGTTSDDIKQWTPETSNLELVSKLDTKQANNKGAVSFLGTVKVDTSDKLTTQTIDIENGRIGNFVEQDSFTVKVEGGYELDSVPNRVIVSFEKCEITFKSNGFVLDLSFLFALRALFKGGVRASGWLETTYLDQDIRIGRGNRGSLFVLTRDRAAVSP